MPRSFYDELRATAAELEADDAVKVVVVHGAGKCFSVGGDIEDFGNIPEGVAARRAYMREALNGFRAWDELPKPVIAAVHGHALGGGCELTMVCDIVVADETARFGTPEAGVGLVPGPGHGARARAREPALDEVHGAHRPAADRRGGPARRAGQHRRARGRAPRRGRAARRHRRLALAAGDLGRQGHPRNRARGRRSSRSPSRSRCCRSARTSPRASPRSRSAVPPAFEERGPPMATAPIDARTRPGRDAARAPAAALRRRDGEHEALVFPDARLTYASWPTARGRSRLAGRARRAARRARRDPDDQPPGHRGLDLRRSRCRAPTVVPVNARYRTAELGSIVEDADMVALLTHDRRTRTSTSPR